MLRKLHGEFAGLIVELIWPTEAYVLFAALVLS